MLGNILPPYHSLQELNLDWILTKVKDMLRFLPDDGSVGQILRRTAHGAEWSNEQGGGGGAVNSVNGQTGDVVLDKTDIGLGNVDNVQQYSASNPPPYPVTSVNGQTGSVSISIPSKTSDLVNDSGFVDAAGAAAAAPVQSVNGSTGAVTITKSSVGLSNVDNVQQYSASNPPPYPVTSVNGQTGDVTVSGGWTKFGTPVTGLSFPYSVTADGVLYYRFTVVNSANPSWAYIRETNNSWFLAQAYTTNGVAVAGNIPVKKGWDLDNPTRQNCNLFSLMFIPFE